MAAMEDEIADAGAMLDAAAFPETHALDRWR